MFQVIWTQRRHVWTLWGICASLKLNFITTFAASCYVLLTKLPWQLWGTDCVSSVNYMSSLLLLRNSVEAKLNLKLRKKRKLKLRFVGWKESSLRNWLILRKIMKSLRKMNRLMNSFLQKSSSKVWKGHKQMEIQWQTTANNNKTFPSSTAPLIQTVSETTGSSTEWPMKAGKIW